MLYSHNVHYTSYILLPGRYNIRRYSFVAGPDPPFANLYICLTFHSTEFHKDMSCWFYGKYPDLWAAISEQTCRIRAISRICSTRNKHWLERRSINEAASGRRV